VADAKDTNWKVYRPEWYNDRILETFISSPIIDKQNDKIDTDTMKESMDFFMKYGVYSYKHEEMPVGLPLAYKIKNGKLKIRVGIHNRLPMHDRVWEEMKIYGDKGGSSIRGEAEKQEKVCEGDVCHNNISELSLWSVSWVGNRPANPEATVTQVAAAKANEPVKVTKQVTLDEIEGMVEKIIERKNGEYCLYAKKNRKLLGCHKTRAGAVNQERAIQARRFSKMSAALDEMLKPIRAKKWTKIDKQLDSILEKAPKRRRSKNPPKTYMDACRFNARKLRNYRGGTQVFNERAFCAELWRNPGKYSGRGPKNTPSRVRNRSGYELRNKMGRPGWNPSEQLTRQTAEQLFGKK
tara:strand:- start:2638 stop:3693 length:1056 start_codon:yes stop_codon:yes gene_type:complete